MTFNPYGGEVLVKVQTGEGIVSSVITAGFADPRRPGFIGFASSSGIRSVMFSVDGDTVPIIDNFTFATPTPEVATLSTALAGLGILVVLGRRRRPLTQADDHRIHGTLG
jgi:hypothetical protein